VDLSPTFFFLKGNSNIAVSTQPHGVPFHIRHEIKRDEVMVTFVAPLATAGLGELDAIAFHTIHNPNWGAVRTDYLCVFLDLSCINHLNLLFALL
jgi:hypothetical protein